MDSSATVDDDLQVPSTATLISSQVRATLTTSTGVTIPISPASCRQQDDPNKDSTGPHPPPRRSLLVGRQAATADIRIQHGSISRKHALLYYNNNDSDDHLTTTKTHHQLVVIDLGGKHGTTVNEQRIPSQQAIVLQDGDRIMFGNGGESVFQVNIVPQQQQEPLQKGAQEETTTTSSATVDNDQDRMKKAGEGLTGRAKRQAEIEAMMASLDEAPTYHHHHHQHQQQQHQVQQQHQDYSTDAKTQQRQQQQQQQQQTQLAQKHQLPVTRTFIIPSESDRRNAVTCVAVDPAGARFVVGSTDRHLRFFDFAGMAQQAGGSSGSGGGGVVMTTMSGSSQSFRDIIPDEGHWPVSCAFSNTGDRVLVGTGSVQPVVLDREGQEVIQFVRGDMYVTDQTKTSGHTAAVTEVDWHPLERDYVLTSSNDGSARIWNLKGRTQFKKLVCDKAFSAKNVKGQRTAVTTVCFHPGGREFALGTSCGSIQIWNRSRVSGRPERAVYAAHGENRPVTSLTYNVDGTKLASRGAETNIVKVWNAQRMSRSSTPLVSCNEGRNVHEHANAAFSPDGKILCVGVAEVRRSADRRKEEGRLHFYNVNGEKSSVHPLMEIDLPADCSPVVVKWHPRVNQIFVGCSDGQTLILYDPKLSKKGAILAASKVGRTVDDLTALLNSRAPSGSAGISGEIITPNALPMYREDRTDAKKRKREERKDPMKSREPERPATGKHKAGGQTGANLTFAQFVADQTMTKSKAIAGMDPREALLKYAEGKSFVEGAYEGNKKILAEKTAVEEEEEFKSQHEK